MAEHQHKALIWQTKIVSRNETIPWLVVPVVGVLKVPPNTFLLAFSALGFPPRPPNIPEPPPPNRLQRINTSKCDCKNCCIFRSDNIYTSYIQVYIV